MEEGLADEKAKWKVMVWDWRKVRGGGSRRRKVSQPMERLAERT